LLGPLSGWNIIHYFLKEIKYYNLGEGTARQIAAVFKERVYKMGPHDSPAEILIDIAENEFGLNHLSIPEPVRDKILQRWDESDEAQPANRAEGEGDPAARRDAAVSPKR
jgi:homocitrate synthase